MLNDPPSAEVSIDALLDIRPLNEPIQIRKLIDTVGTAGSPFCYVYE
jgi:hypothetical protein